MGAVLPGPAPTPEQADGLPGSPADTCALDGRWRDSVGGPGVGPWHVYRFPDDSRRTEFMARWEHDLELRLR